MNFIRQVGSFFWRERTWDARAALEFIGTSGGKLSTLPPDQPGWLRRELLAIKNSDDFLWVLRWLRQEQHCNPVIYADLIRTPSMKRKMELVNRGGR